jgi:DNA-binding LacI/PurR family transcriptional regulator
VLSIDRPSPSIRQFPEAVATAAEAAGPDVRLRHVLLPFDDDASFPNPVAAARVDALLDAILHSPTTVIGNGEDGAGTDTPPFIPDAVLCAESYSLHAVEAWLARHPEVRVPDDMAIASFDRIPTRHVVRVLPAIPRADFDNATMMRTAIEMIEQDLGGRRVEPKLRRVPAVVIGE